MGYWRLQNPSFIHLKEVTIELCDGSNGIPFAKYILEHAQNLKKMKIVYPPHQSYDVDKLKKSKMASNIATVVFNEEEIFLCGSLTSLLQNILELRHVATEDDFYFYFFIQLYLMMLQLHSESKLKPIKQTLSSVLSSSQEIRQSSTRVLDLCNFSQNTIYSQIQPYLKPFPADPAGSEPYLKRTEVLPLPERDMGANVPNRSFKSKEEDACWYVLL
ncbi:hypothetical protein COP1_013933 [Malus domestica]